MKIQCHIVYVKLKHQNYLAVKICHCLCQVMISLMLQNSSIQCLSSVGNGSIYELQERRATLSHLGCLVLSAKSFQSQWSRTKPAKTADSELKHSLCLGLCLICFICLPKTNVTLKSSIRKINCCLLNRNTSHSCLCSFKPSIGRRVYNR